MTIEDRIVLFWSHVDRTNDDACWETDYVPNPNGYTTIRVLGNYVYAHRFAYEIERGEIPEGLHIDHLCRNRRCVNPAHMEPVTPRVNVIRGESFAAKNAKKTHCARGHAYDEANTYWYGSTRHCRACGRLNATVYRERRIAA